MSFLYHIAAKLGGAPKMKRCLKDIYQFAGAVLSDKKSVPGEIVMQSDSRYEHLFGYYDKCPWSADGTRMVYLRVDGADRHSASDREAQIILKDADGERAVAATRAWNVQQGCMLQWLGGDFNSKIIFNDYIDGEYKSVVLDLASGQKRVFHSPVYSVDALGKSAVCLDFSRLQRLRPGYGYVNLPDRHADEPCPDRAAIWRLDLQSGAITPLITYTGLAGFAPSPGMQGAVHKVNHLMINPAGTRFMFLHRWQQGKRRYTRLVTMDMDGGGLYNLLDEGMVSHCNWRDDKTVIAWAYTRLHGNQYYSLTDGTQDRELFLGGRLMRDGHPSTSPDGRLLITDSYPDFRRKQALYLCDLQSGGVTRIASVYAPFRYRNDTRCDLHPRWSPDSKQICFDAAMSGKRQVYTIKL